MALAFCGCCKTYNCLDSLVFSTCFARLGETKSRSCIGTNFIVRILRWAYADRMIRLLLCRDV